MQMRALDLQLLAHPGLVRASQMCPCIHYGHRCAKQFPNAEVHNIANVQRRPSNLEQGRTSRKHVQQGMISTVMGNLVWLSATISMPYLKTGELRVMLGMCV